MCNFPGKIPFASIKSALKRADSMAKPGTCSLPVVANYAMFRDSIDADFRRLERVKRLQYQRHGKVLPRVQNVEVSLYVAKLTLLDWLAGAVNRYVDANKIVGNPEGEALLWFFRQESDGLANFRKIITC